MARNSLKNVARLIDVANNEVPIEKQFQMDLIASIEKAAEKNDYIPSKTFKPSSMNCVRNMTFQLLGTKPDKNTNGYQLNGICDSGTDRHLRIQKALCRMKELGFDLEYIDVETFIKERNLTDLEVVEKKEMETKLYNKKYNISFLTDGIIRYKSKYYIFEFKTETADKFYRRTDVDPKHYNQSTTYALSFNLNDTMFLYENRNTCDLKAFIKHTAEDEKEEIVNKMNYCTQYAKDNKVPPKPEIDKKQCTYCAYKSTCERSAT